MKDFDEIYTNIAINKGTEVENIRKVYRKKVNMLITGIILFFILIAIITSIMIKNDITLLILCILIIPIFAIFIFVLSSKIRDIINEESLYKTRYKSDIIEPLIKYYDENLTYEPKKGMSPEEYTKAGFSVYDRYNSEDYIYGHVEGIGNCFMSEVLTQRESTNSDGDTIYYTMFSGVFAKTEIDKNLNKKVMIVKNSTKINGKNNRVELDWNEFEKIYEVYSKNNILAVRILTSDVMKMLIAFQKENKIVPEIVLVENCIYVRFLTGAIFEETHAKSLIDYDILKRYYNIINFTFDIMKEMKKNIDNIDL